MAEEDFLLRFGANLSDLERAVRSDAPRLGRAFAESVAGSVATVRFDVPLVNVAAMRSQGAAAGQAFADGIGAELRTTSPAIQSLRTDLAALARTANAVRLGGAAGDDITALRELLGEELRVAEATAGARGEVLALSAALRTLNENANGDVASLRTVESLLANLEQTTQRLRSLPALGTTLVTSPGDAEQRAAVTARAAEQERAARAQASAELQNEIRTVALYGRAVDATNATAVAAWREEAAAIRAQALELNFSREQLARLDGAIQSVEQRFARAAGTSGASGAGALVKSTGEFSAVGMRAANTAIAVAFGLESLASRSRDADAGIRTALRAVAAFGPALGPEGLLVSGVAAATAAILDMVHATTPAEDAVRKYVEEIKAINPATASASAGVRNLTEAQAAQRTFLLRANLQQAQQDIGTVKANLLQALDAGSFRQQIKDFFSVAGVMHPEAITGFTHDMQAIRNEVLAGHQDFDQLGQAILRLGDKYPQLRERTRGLIDDLIKLDNLRGVATGLQNALATPFTGGAAGGGGFDTGLGEQIANARELARAYRSGGDTAREGLALAQSAFIAWRASQKGVVAETLTFRDALRGLGGDTARQAAEAFRRDADELARLNASARESKQAIRDLDAELRAFRERVEASGGLQIRLTPGSETELARAQTEISSRLLTSKLAAVPLELDTTRVRGGLGEVEQALRAVKEAESDLDFAKAFGGDAAIRGATDQLRDAQVAAREAARAVLPFILSITDPKLRQSFLARFKQDLQDIGAIVPQVDRVSVTLRTVGTAVHGVTQIADAFGAVDDNLRRSIDGAAGFLTSLADIRQALATLRQTNATAGLGDLFKTGAGITSLVGIVGGAASLISGVAGLFKPDPEVVAIQRRNNDLLTELNQNLAGYTNSLGTITTVIDRLAATNVGEVARAARGIGAVAGPDEAVAFFDRHLVETGLSLADLQRVAKDNGIELLDSKGRLVAEAFDQLQAVLTATREVALRWGNTLDALTEQHDLFNQIHDIDLTSASGMTRAVLDSADILKNIAPKLYERIFSGLDLGTAAGRATLNDRFNQIVDEEMSAEFKAGRGWLAELLKESGFTNLVDFNKWLLSADGALDAFTKSTQAATDALGNVPVAFKALVDAARFGATARGLPAAVPPTTSPLGPSGLPPGGLLNGPAPVTQQFGPGSIVINGVEMDAEELWRLWTGKATQLARANNGANAPLDAAWRPLS